jgi:hypothetical protein
MCWKKPNIKVHSATSYLIFQYLQYWYNQYFPESSSICNTGITSIFQNLPVSAILVLPVFPRISRYLQYSYFGNDQYLPVLQILEDTGILVFTSICTSIADTGRFWLNTGTTSIVYQYCNTSIAAGCFILSKSKSLWVNTIVLFVCQNSRIELVCIMFLTCWKWKKNIKTLPMLDWK